MGLYPFDNIFTIFKYYVWSRLLLGSNEYAHYILISIYKNAGIFYDAHYSLVKKGYNQYEFDCHLFVADISSNFNFLSFSF